jgi:hypothetical protein
MLKSLIFTLLIVYINSEPCPNACSSHGRCKSPGRQCECFEGFTGADCSLKVCAFGKAWSDIASGIDEAHNEAECSNMGLCNRDTGLCLCRQGFDGNACERQACPSSCNGVGECESMYYHALSKDPGTGQVYDYTNQWDAYKIYGCNCDQHYHGTDCSLRFCPKGDDPLTGTNEISSKNPLQFNEIQRITCKADGGTFTLKFRGKTTLRIPFNAKGPDLQHYIESIPSIGKGNVKIVMYGPQACLPASVYWTVEFLQDFGDLPLLVGDIRKLTYSNALSNPTLDIIQLVEGTKEDLECSNRGLCDTSSGICSCSNDFTTSNGYNQPGSRGDCGYATEAIQYCPGDITCSAHGLCLQEPTYKCQCADGWTGADCSERLCPQDLAWFALPESDNIAHINTYLECSNAGICDRSTGQCVCNPGFTGASCNRMSCAGQQQQSSIDNSDACSSHGQCLDMNALASFATLNGDYAGFTYGDTPNNPVTWDANRVYGCYCDAQYTGYDCSLYRCPYGDDPDTINQLDEVQIISCTDSDLSNGNFVLSFRQESTATLSPEITTLELKNALESLSTIGKVYVETVTTGATNQLCTIAGNQFAITFLTEHSDLPKLKSVFQDIDYFTIVEDVKGNKENIECSGRGLCNYSTGQCECFEGYGSSDGQGTVGITGDCGYVLPVSN